MNGLIIGSIGFIIIVLVILAIKNNDGQEHFGSCSGKYPNTVGSSQNNQVNANSVETANFVSNVEPQPDSKCGPCICPKINIKDLKCNSCDSSNYVPKDIYEQKVKELENKALSQKYDCDKAACAEMARKYPGTICSNDKSPCLWIQKEIKMNAKGLTCPAPAVCPPAQTKVIRVSEPNEKCNNTYNVYPVKKVQEMDNIISKLEILVDTNRNDLTESQWKDLNNIKLELNKINTMSRDQLVNHHKDDHKHTGDPGTPAEHEEDLDPFIDFKIPGEKHDRRIMEGFESGINYSDFL